LKPLPDLVILFSDYFIHFLSVCLTANKNPADAGLFGL